LERKDVADDGTITGYGSVFGVTDSYGDVVARGAFGASLAEWRRKDRMPALLWQHNQATPIGTWLDMREDSTGLYVKGRIATETAAGHDAYVLVKSGALSGLSIGFFTRKATFDEATGLRTLTAIDLFEVSIVTFPANDDARVESIRRTSSIECAEMIEAIKAFGRHAVEGEGAR
jgi:HK97 family phage prohead protease